ncbi:MAG: DUF58 domain-containing protein [Halanaeroarchaeum sp.]
MQLTRRGRVAVFVIVAAIAIGWAFGSRSLNAVAVTALIALVVGWIQLRVADPPSVERSTPRSGFPGEQRSISLSVEGSRGTIVEVSEELPAGLDASEHRFEGSIPFEHSYRLTYTGRGQHAIGPATVRLRDALGLLERVHRLTATTPVLVYPTVHDVGGSDVLASMVRHTRTPDRQEIDELREYVPGDPLRDIAWKASAKRMPDLVVVEFAGDETTGTVELAASANDAGIDRAASALASIALFLLDAGLRVGVTVPGGRLEPGLGRQHRRDLLALLAETDQGAVPERAWNSADLRVRGGTDSVTVETGADSVEFETLRSGDRSLQFSDPREWSPEPVGVSST